MHKKKQSCRSLSLSRPTIFNDANIIDNIHQAIINLELKPDKNEIQLLLSESIFYVGNDLNLQEINELYVLILHCLSQVPDQTDDFYNSIFEDSKKSSNHLVLFAKIFSIKQNKSFNPAVQDFIKDLMDQIAIQIQQPQDKFIINNFEIKPQHILDFVINITLMSELNENLISIIYPFIFSKPNVTNIKELSKKVIKKEYLSIIPEIALTNKDFLNNIPYEHLATLIYKLSEPAFHKVVTLLSDCYRNIWFWSKSIATAILNKCIEYNYDIKSNQKLYSFIFDSIDDTMMKHSIWDYFEKNDITLTQQVASKIKSYSNPIAALKIMPNIEQIPQNIVTQSLLETNDINIFERASNYNFDDENDDVLSQKKFWVHFFGAISSSEQNYSKSLLIKFLKVFEKYIQKEKIYEVLEAMICDNFPATNNGNNFLVDFLNKLDNKENFIQNAEVLFKKIIDISVLPLPSFWKIFDCETIKNFNTNKDNAISVLYALKFSNNKTNIKKVDSIALKSIKKDSSIQFVVEFIKNLDLDLLPKMDEDSLEFIVSVFLYIDENVKPELLCKSKDTIFPLVAISLNYLVKKKNTIYIPKSEEFECLLLKACKQLPLNKSHLILESINSILEIDDYLFDLSMFQKDFPYQLYKILTNQLVNNTYNADKLILLRAIFKLSHKYATDKQAKAFFDKYGINLFKFIIKNRSNIDNFDSLLDIGLSSHVFKLKQVSSTLIEIIENSTDYNELINTIWFINNIYQKCPKLKNIECKNICKFYNEINENWDDLNTFIQFIKKYKSEKDYSKLILRISHSFNVKKIISKTIENQTPEKINLQCELLFKILINEYSNAANYILVLFEKFGNTQEITAKEILEKYKSQYQNYNACFMDIFRKVFQYNSDSFIRKPNFIGLSDPPSNFSISFISCLLNEAKNAEGNYKVFYYLKSIASSFPFIFTKNQINMFSAVFSALNHFILLFTLKKENTNLIEINNLKTALSALSFLFSSLYSVKILDAFIPWIYKKIDQFNQSQLLAITFIFDSLFNTQKVNKVMFALSSKYNLPDVVIKLLEFDVQNDISTCYRNNIYSILNKHYQLLNELNNTKDYIYFDEIKKFKNPFQHYFNGFCTIYPEKLKPLDLPIPDVIEIKNFVNEINEIRSFWLDFEKIEEVNCDEIDNFMCNFNNTKKKNQNNKSNLREINAQSMNQIKKIRFCAKQPYWIYKYIVQNDNNKISYDHYNEIKNVIKQLNNLPPGINDEEKNYYEVGIDHFYSSDLKNTNLFDLLIKDAISNDVEKNEQLLLLINEIFKNNISAHILIDLLNTHMLQNLEIHDYPKKIINFVNNLKIFHNQNLKFKFAKQIGKNLLDVVLSPEYRKNDALLTFTADILSSLDNLPDRVIHLILFMIMNHLDCSKFDNLLKKIDNKNLDIVILNIINNITIKQSENDVSYYYIFFNKLIECNPSINLDMKTSLNILETAISKSKENIWIPKCTLCFIFNLLNIITPKRIENDLNIPPTEENNNNILKNAHPELIKANPDFWNFYEKHLKFFNENLDKNKQYLEKLTIIEYYPELFNFEKRLSDFRKKMQNKIFTNKEIRIEADRSNILPNSFTFLKNKSRDDWLSRIKVSFKGERGVDVGGLTKEWFTLVVKELFNPNFALFVLTQNNSYQPNPFSGVNQEHIEFFRFAGKLIARAIINGLYVDAHFTRSFCRQILGSEVHIRDLEDVDNTIYKSLQTILNEDVEPLGLNFTIDINEYGAAKTVLLKENGDQIDVTNKNKDEYVKLYTEYKLRKSIIDQVNAFCEGFNWLISVDETKLFTPYELDLIICGNNKIDIDDFRKNTFFIMPYSLNHPVIKLFFNALSKWDSKNLSKFLLFLTGSSQVPVNGFKGYKENGKQIQIAPGGDKNRLCVAHTCFNTLDLPEYENEDELNSKLLQSIEECRFVLA